MPIKFDENYWKENCWTYKNGLEGKIKGAILAAGLGKRMDPLTVTHLPKPLFPLGGKVPMAEIWVRRFVNSGITDVSMNLCVLSETIKRYFKDGSKFAANISYVHEDVPTGTLGGVCKQALGRNSKSVYPDETIPQFKEFGGTTLIVPSGDVVTNFGAELLEKMYEIHKSVGSKFTMVLVPIPEERKKDFGTVVLENPKECHGIICNSGPIKEFREKDPNSPSNLNNASIYMIEMDLIRILDKYRTAADVTIEKPFYDFGKHVFPAMLDQLPYIKLPEEYKKLLGIQYNGEWFDVGQKRDYLKVNKSLLDNEINITLPYEKLPWGYMGTNTVVDYSKITIIPPVVIGNNCEIRPGATIGPYAVIGDGWKIEKGATVRHTVLWERLPYFTKDGKEISIEDRKLVDWHEIKRNVTVEWCIVAGGIVEENIKEKTVDVLEDGSPSINPIDYVPKGPRA